MWSAGPQLVAFFVKGQHFGVDRDGLPLRGLRGRPAVFPGDPPEDLPGQETSPIAIGHDHGAPAAFNEHRHQALEALVRAAVPEVRPAAEAVETKAKAVTGFLDGRHLPGQGLRQDGRRAPPGQQFLELGGVRGGFFLALASGAPIVPVTIRGTFELMPKGQWYARRGKVGVMFHDPVPVAGLTEEAMGALMETVRRAVLSGME